MFSCRFTLFKLFKNVPFVVDCFGVFTFVLGCSELCYDNDNDTFE